MVAIKLQNRVYGRKFCFVALASVALLLTELAVAGPCEILDSTPTILNCALERHPDAKISELGVAQAADGESVARQRVNPEVNSQTVFGGEASNKFYTELNFAHTFELGGKRDARIKKSEAELKRSQASALQSREQVYLTTLLALYRIRQIQDEVTAVDNALQTFSRIGKQYRSRPKLSPDQRASLRIFEIAEQDYRMKRAPLEAETDLHLREIELALGRSYIPKSSVLPKKKRSWPKLPESPSPTGGGYRLLEFEAEIARAHADFGLARSSGWPDLKIGPTITMQRQGSQSFEAYGFNFSLPLPLYHRNSAGEAFASRGIERASLALRAARRENEDQKGYFRKRYLGAVDVLQKSVTAEELSKKHEEVEALFRQGFLNGTVVVEVNRQVSDFIKTQNEQELAAIESLVRYHALEGKLVEVSP